MQIKAGKMIKNGKILSPDLRSGILSFILNPELEGMIQITWQENSSSAAEDEFFILPGDCTFKRIEQCKTGRVFALQFTSAPSKKSYFWIQQPESELSDEQILQQSSQILSIPPTPPSTVQIDWQKVAAQLKPIKLEQVFTDREILTLVQTPQFKERLWKTLPPCLRDSGLELEQIIRSPQFSYTLAMFEEALKSGEMNSILLSLGLDPAVGTSFGGGIRRLLEAIRQKARIEEQSEMQE